MTIPIPRQRHKQAFMLVQMLVVLGIIGILVGALAYANRSAKVRAYNVQALMCAEQIRKAQANFYATNGGHFGTYAQLDTGMLSRCNLVEVTPVNETASGYEYNVKHSLGSATYTPTEADTGVGQQDTSIAASNGAATAPSGPSSSGGSTGGSGGSAAPPAPAGPNMTPAPGSYFLDIQPEASPSPKLGIYGTGTDKVVITNSSGATVGSYDYTTNTPSGGGYLPGGTYTVTYTGSPTGQINVGPNGARNFDQIIHRNLATFVTIGGTPTNALWTDESVVRPNSFTFALTANGTVGESQLEVIRQPAQSWSAAGQLNGGATDSNLGSFRLIEFYDTATPFKNTRACTGRCWEDGSWTITADQTLTATGPNRFPFIYVAPHMERGDIRTALVDMKPRVAGNPVTLWAQTRTPSDIVLSPVTQIGWPDGYSLTSPTTINLNLQSDLDYMATLNWYTF